MDEHRKKVFVVEDDEHISKVYEMKLSQVGLVSSFEKTGEGAVARIAAERPDLIVLDMMLPKKDGFAVLEEIKKDPTLAQIPVLVLSNLGQQSDRDHALELGAKEYLIKVEHSMQEVVDKVKQYLGIA